MALQYNPEDAVTAWPEGDYQAVLKAVKAATSKVKADGSGGNPMEVWTFEVYHLDGRQQDIDDYVVVPACTFKIKQLAKALGKASEFDAGQFQAENYIGRSVTVALRIEQQKDFDDQNKVGKVKPPASNATERALNTPARQPAQRPVIQSPIRPGEPVFEEADIPF